MIATSCYVLEQQISRVTERHVHCQWQILRWCWGVRKLKFTMITHTQKKRNYVLL